jgi:hypothetical protein
VFDARRRPAAQAPAPYARLQQLRRPSMQMAVPPWPSVYSMVLMNAQDKHIVAYILSESGGKDFLSRIKQDQGLVGV